MTNGRSALPILMYHSVDDSFDPRYRRWAVTPDTFCRHMQLLSDGGWQVTTVSEVTDRLDSGAGLPPRTVALTFDDGLRDFADNAAPVLRRFGFGATLYVVAGHVGGCSAWLGPLGEQRRPMLDPAELRELASAGIEIGAHSMTHPELDVLSEARARDEILRSRVTLEDLIGHRVRSFAYPHGYASRTTRRFAREAGYASAVRVHHALSSCREDRFGLSRIIVTEDLGVNALLRLMSGDGLAIAPSHDRLLARGWRLVRRARGMARAASGWRATRQTA